MGSTWRAFQSSMCTAAGLTELRITRELVDNHEFESGEFPRLKKRAIFDKAGSGAYIIDADAGQPFVPRSDDGSGT